jgi:hypothetical protein
MVVEGLLERRTYPGPPNYESTANGDEAETGFYLKPPSPLCVRAGADSSLNPAQSDVADVQLELDSAGYARLRPSLGQDVSLRGTLSAAISGHHHAPLLLMVVSPAPR